VLQSDYQVRLSQATLEGTLPVLQAALLCLIDLLTVLGEASVDF
jgi:hypothetical protein